MANKKSQFPKGLHIHRIKPVLLGGDPADNKNVQLITRKQHAELVVFWNNVIKDAKGNQ